jgi:hypothetical protein
LLVEAQAGTMALDLRLALLARIGGSSDCHGPESCSRVMTGRDGPSSLSQLQLNANARQLNGRPRMTLGFRTPADKFSECVGLTG